MLTLSTLAGLFAFVIYSPPSITVLVSNHRMENTSTLQDRIYLLSNQAVLHDAVISLSHPITFTTDRVAILFKLKHLLSKITTDASTISPARIAFYFHHTEPQWQCIVKHICHCVLKNINSSTATSITNIVSSQEIQVSLHLLKAILLVWPPSIKWQSPNLLIPRICMATSVIGVLKMSTRENQSLQLLVVDVVMAYACALKIVKCYTIKDSTDTGSKDSTDSKDNTDRTDSTHSRGKIKQEMANEMDIEISKMISNTFERLSGCCAFEMDQSNVYDPHQQKKQQRNMAMFVNVFEELVCSSKSYIESNQVVW